MTMHSLSSKWRSSPRIYAKARLVYGKFSHRNLPRAAALPTSHNIEMEDEDDEACDSQLGAWTACLAGACAARIRQHHRQHSCCAAGTGLCGAAGTRLRGST